MHDLAIQILAGDFSGLALRRRQIQELEARADSDPERLAFLRVQCADLERAVAELRSAETIHRAFSSLCELLDRLTWQHLRPDPQQPGRCVCRLCGGEKPTHKLNCEIVKWLQQLEQERARP